MVEKTEIQIFADFEWISSLITAALPKGKDAERLYKAHQDLLQKEFGNNPHLSVLSYDENSREIMGSNFFVGGSLYRIISPSGLRVAVPGDDFNDDILRLIERDYFFNFNALAFREKPPYLKKNMGLWIKVNELAEERHVKAPFVAQGFYVVLDIDKKEYGLTIVPAQNFKIFHDDRVLGKYDEWGFDEVDKRGLPVSLSRNGGSRIFYSRDDGLSGVTLCRCGNLNLGGDDLSWSGGIGRVVLVKASN